MTGPGAAAVGIDFGTTHTVVSVATADGRVQPVLFDSSPLLSSAVYAADDRLLVGRDAERSARLDPARFEPNPKRRIDEGTILLGEREYPIADVIAAVLRRALDEATRVAGGPTASSLLTYPANWSGPRRKLLVDAAGRAGFGHVVLIPEPVAAAVYFTTVLGNEVPVGSAIVVYDLGGGTFDTSVVRRVPGGGFEVAASDGIDVGGLDLDAVIVDQIGRTLATTDRALWERLVDRGDPADRRHQQSLWDEARGAKEQLSRASSAAVRVPLFDSDAFVTREEFELGARPALERTVELTASTLWRTGLRREQVAGVFLVGGSSRIPLVGTLLHQRFGIAPTLIEQPELVVSLGSIAAARNAPGFAPGQSPGIAVPLGPGATRSPGYPVAVGTPTSVAPTSGAPTSGAPTSGTPTSGTPTSGAPAPDPQSGVPLSSAAAPVWPPAPQMGAAAGPYPPYQPVRRASFGRRLILLSAAALVAIVLLSIGAAKAWDLASHPGSAAKGGASPTRTAGARTGNGGTGAGTGSGTDGGSGTNTGAQGGNGGPAVEVNKTVWYAQFKITFGSVSYDPTPNRAVLTAETVLDNLGDKDLRPDIPIVFSTGGQSYEGRARENSTTVAAGQKSNVHLDFEAPQGLAGPIAKGVFTIGRGDEAQAVVPATGDGLVPYEPKPVLGDTKLVQRDLSSDFTRCELRGGFTSFQGQAKKGNLALTCSVDIQYTGGSSLYVGEEHFRLGLPDGTEIGPTVAPNEALYSAKLVPDTYLGFMIKWPAPGRYTLRVVNVHSGEKRSPANVAEVTLNL